MTLYETIFKRRSVRKYNKNLLPPEVLNNIQSYIDGLKQLNGQNVRLKIVSADAVKNDKAPHYILAYCGEGAAELINAGYCLQEVDLYIQSIGLGSLWLGTARPKKEEKEKDYRIMLAFGATDMPLRSKDSDFDRLPLSSICDCDSEVIRAARLAPSAMNSQPWKIMQEDGKITINYFGRGLLKAVLKSKFSKIDIGIIAKHTEFALKNSGKTILAVTPFEDNKSFGVSIVYN